MTENEAKLEKVIAEDYKAVLHEAKSMGCNNIRALYNIPLKNMELIIKALEEVQQYRTIGTPEECRAAMERSNEKTRIIDGVTECCGYDFGIDAFRIELSKFYPVCGRKIERNGEK
mgnify:CR=1 FL=1